MQRIGSVLPRLLVIADGFTEPDRYRCVLELATARALPWVQLRDHAAPSGIFRRQARALVSEIRSVNPPTEISINGDAELAGELGVAVHLGHRAVSPTAARSTLGSEAVIGYSAHANDTIEALRAHPCQYVTYSPVYPVRKSTSVEPLGLERLARMAKAMPIPVLALGGITPGRVSDCLSAGAYGIAVLSGVMDKADPVAAANAYRDAIEHVVGSGSPGGR